MTSPITAERPTTRGPRLALTASRLRALLTVDATGCAALGIVGLAATGSLEELLGASRTVVVVAALGLLVYAVGAALVARRPDRRGLLALVVLNAGFALGTGIVAVTAGLTAYGVALAVSLAAVSLVVAELLLLARRDVSAS